VTRGSSFFRDSTLIAARRVLGSVPVLAISINLSAAAGSSRRPSTPMICSRRFRDSEVS
jgi:hypothetical protein